MNTPKEFPFKVDDLCAMQFSFDTLKRAIEYLAKQQYDQ
jgi:hypothetical protein